MIENIRKTGIVISIIGAVLVGLISMRIEFVIAFLLGCFVSYLNLSINERFLDLSGSRTAVRNNLISFLGRIFTYVLLFSLIFKFFGIIAMIIAFVGGMTIRISILIAGLKGV